MELFKPCPFCGGRTLRVKSQKMPFETSEDGWYAAYVYCTQCNGRGPTVFGEKGQNEVPARKLAIENWNRRTYDV